MTKTLEFDANATKTFYAKTNTISTVPKATKKSNSDTVTEMQTTNLLNKKAEEAKNFPKQSRCFVPRCRMFNRFDSQLIIRTLTCNKLSHCLFDFDCEDFNVYEQETYNYQEMLFKNLRHD